MGCGTNQRALTRDSLVPVPIAPAFCLFTTGRWYSSYDGIVTDDPGALAIDHVVALREAWASGGTYAWDDARRAAFVNDLTDRRTLIAVTAGVDQSKGDHDPASWPPPLPGRDLRLRG